MNRATYLRYGILVGALVLVVLAIIFLPRLGGIGNVPTVPRVSQITRIELAKGADSITLREENAVWVVGEEGYRADNQAISQITDTLKDLTLTDRIGNAELLTRFDLDEDDRIEVKAYDGEKLVRHLYVGKAANTGRHTYVLFPEDDSVYNAEGSFAARFKTKADDVRSKQLADIDAGNISELQISENGAVFTLTKSSHTPDVASGPPSPGEEAPSTEPVTIWNASWTDSPRAHEGVNSVLTQIATLTADGFTEIPDGTPLRVLTAKSATGEVEITIYPGENEAYIATVAGRIGAFILSKEAGDTLTTPTSEFAPATL